jgi:hypothetical protein
MDKRDKHFLPLCRKWKYRVKMVASIQSNTWELEEYKWPKIMDLGGC